MADTTVSTDTAPAAPPITTPPAATSEPTGTTEAPVATAPAATSEVADPAEPKINFPPKDNAVIKAINRCLRAWDYAYDKEAADLGEDDDDSDARQGASEAYLRATPPLSGYENICDFIACINHASLIGIISEGRAQHFLANARIALSTIYHQPKPFSEPRTLGRPKSSPNTHSDGRKLN
jgi:hypothetical protein